MLPGLATVGPFMLHAQMHCSGSWGGTGIASGDKSRATAGHPEAESARCESHIQGQKIESSEYIASGDKSRVTYFFHTIFSFIAVSYLLLFDLLQIACP